MWLLGLLDVDGLPVLLGVVAGVVVVLPAAAVAEAVVLLFAVAWNCSNVISAVGLIAPTMPAWQ